MIPGRKSAALALTALAFAAAPAMAAKKSTSQVFLGQFGAWYAYQLNEKAGRVCYMVSKPTRTRGKYKKRGDVVVFVTHRPKDGERDVVNFQAGYTYKPGAKATASVDKRKFTLTTERDAAWSPNAAADKVLVQAMIKGTRMVLRGQSRSGVTTTDTYSLKGFTRAHKRINRACGVK
jgi:invasion protein IalB